MKKQNRWVSDYVQLYPNESFLKQGFTIQQFTGVLDKNLREIYEGDIVKAGNRNKGYIEYECQYSNEEAAFILKNEDSFVYLSDFDSLEVVSNIFQEKDIADRKSCMDEISEIAQKLGLY
jgi:uncharacterized phage protein (TIGR01671 family)